MSRARLAPIKELSIPRLELTALLVGHRLARFLLLEANLSFEECHLWSDSRVALCWIMRNESKEVYVSNRVAEIRKHSFPIHFVPTQENPADILSRGQIATKLDNNQLWRSGPIFLVSGQWPKQPDDHLIANISLQPTIRPPILENPIELKKYSSLTRLCTATRGVMRVFARWSKRSLRPLSPLGFLIKMEQRLYYPETLRFLQHRGAASPEVRTLCHQLGLFVDEFGAIRSKGRIDNAPLPPTTKRPCLLHRKSHLTELLIT